MPDSPTRWKTWPGASVSPPKLFENSFSHSLYFSPKFLIPYFLFFPTILNLLSDFYLELLDRFPSIHLSVTSGQPSVIRIIFLGPQGKLRNASQVFPHTCTSVRLSKAENSAGFADCDCCVFVAQTMCCLCVHTQIQSR